MGLYVTNTYDHIFISRDVSEKRVHVFNYIPLTEYVTDILGKALYEMIGQQQMFYHDNSLKRQQTTEDHCNHS